MPKATGEIVVGRNGTIRVAPEGTAIPESIEDPYDAAWIDLGYASEDGVTMKDGKSIVDIPVWQLAYPALKLVDTRNFTMQHVLRQFAGPQVELAFDGATVTGDVGSGFEIHPPAPEDLNVVAWSVEWLMNDRSWRWFVYRAIVTDDVEFSIARNKATDLPVTLGVLGADGEDPWVVQSNDPHLAQST